MSSSDASGRPITDRLKGPADKSTLVVTGDPCYRRARSSHSLQVPESQVRGEVASDRPRFVSGGGGVRPVLAVLRIARTAALLSSLNVGRRALGLEQGDRLLDRAECFLPTVGRLVDLGEAQERPSMEHGIAGRLARAPASVASPRAACGSCVARARARALRQRTWDR